MRKVTEKRIAWLQPSFLSSIRDKRKRVNCTCIAGINLFCQYCVLILDFLLFSSSFVRTTLVCRPFHTVVFLLPSHARVTTDRLHHHHCLANVRVLRQLTSLSPSPIASLVPFYPSYLFFSFRSPVSPSASVSNNPAPLYVPLRREHAVPNFGPPP